MSVFDVLGKETFAMVAELMGTHAQWLRHDGSATATGMVLFKNPTEPLQIGGDTKYEYRPQDATAEYYADTFAQLKKNVDQGSREYLYINGSTYFVVEVSTKCDGNVCVAHLQLSTEDGC